MLSINELYLVIFALLVFCSMMYGKAKYWEGRYNEMDTTTDSWRSEALFLRHKDNPESAEFSEYN